MRIKRIYCPQLYELSSSLLRENNRYSLKGFDIPVLRAVWRYPMQAPWRLHSFPVVVHRGVWYEKVEVLDDFKHCCSLWGYRWSSSLPVSLKGMEIPEGASLAPFGSKVVSPLSPWWDVFLSHVLPRSACMISPPAKASPVHAGLADREAQKTADLVLLLSSPSWTLQMRLVMQI